MNDALGVSVTQICNLLYRRFAIGTAPRPFKHTRTASCQQSEPHRNGPHPSKGCITPGPSVFPPGTSSTRSWAAPPGINIQPWSVTTSAFFHPPFSRMATISDNPFSSSWMRLADFAPSLWPVLSMLPYSIQPVSSGWLIFLSVDRPCQQFPDPAWQFSTFDPVAEIRNKRFQNAMYPMAPRPFPATPVACLPSAPSVFQR